MNGKKCGRYNGNIDLTGLGRRLFCRSYVQDPFEKDIKLQLLRDHYARALRAIGQDLADLFPQRVEIEMSGADFIARGCRRPGGLALKNSELSQPSAPIQDAGFARTYTPEAIDQLDAMGRARRTGSVQIPNLYSLSERLRMIGRIVDEKNGRLVSLCQNMNTITVQYRNPQNELHQEAYSILTLYKLQQQYYSGRCFKPKSSSPETGQSNL